MSINGSSKNYSTGVVTMRWAGERPSNHQFRKYARENFDVSGLLDVSDPEEYRGVMIPGTATITPPGGVNNG